MVPERGLDSAPRVGERSGSLRGEIEATRPRGVQVSALGVGVLEWSLEGVLVCFVGDGVVVAAIPATAVVVVRNGEGEAGDSGRRNGDVRGELKERGEGL